MLLFLLLPAPAGMVPPEEEAAREGSAARRTRGNGPTADTVYDRWHGVGVRDPLDSVPLYGGSARETVARARAEHAAEETEV